MPFSPFYLLPLASAGVYALSAVFFKRALAAGVDVWRLTFICNWFLFLVMGPLWLAGGDFLGAGFLYQPLLTGAVFVGGQIFNCLALRRGDVSIATPLLGSKVVFVALFSLVAFAEPMPWTWWAGAGLVAVAVLLLRGPKRGRTRHFWPTVLYAGLATAFYALCDILTQKWGGAWGAGRFLPLSMLSAGLLSLPLIRLFPHPRPRWPAAARRAVLAGPLLNGLQGLGLAYALVEFGHATALNILYSSRGIWSVLLVWLGARWMGTEEHMRGGRVMALRLAGAGLILAAIALVLYAPASPHGAR